MHAEIFLSDGEVVLVTVDVNGDEHDVVNMGNTVHGNLFGEADMWLRLWELRGSSYDGSFEWERSAHGWRCPVF